MKIVLSGAIGSGKSTVVREAMRQLGWETPAGFFTHWDGAGRGASALHLSTWAGKSHPVAHRIAEPAVPGELPYALDRALFARIAISSLSAPTGNPVVIDELGVIELGSTEFICALAKVFRGPGPMLAVIQERALDRWLSLMGSESVERVWTVDSANRDALPSQLAAGFRTGNFPSP